MWKKIAIGCLIIFSIIILLNVVRIVKFKSDFRSKFESSFDISEEQREKTLSFLEKVSVEEGYKLEDYIIKIDPKIREINISGQKKHILRINIEKETEFRSYLIDIDNWDVLQSSKIKYGGWMTTKDNQSYLFHIMPPLPMFDIKRGWFHNKLID